LTDRLEVPTGSSELASIKAFIFCLNSATKTRPVPQYVLREEFNFAFYLRCVIGEEPNNQVSLSKAVINSEQFKSIKETSSVLAVKARYAGSSWARH
jgi:hypothetical protein